MAEPIDFSARVTLQVPRAALWEFLADTERMNRAIDLPTVSFVPLPDPSRTGHYQAETRLFGTRVAYEEFPWDWVEGRYYRMLRRFRKGPIEEVSGGLRMADAGSGTELEVFARVIPRAWLGSLVAKRTVRKKATEDIIEFARAFERRFLDAGAPEPAPPPPGLVSPAQLEARCATLLKAPVDAAAAAKLRAHLENAADLDVIRMRPFELADRWGVDRTAALRLFLFAAQAGLVDLTWNVLCPSCRVAARQTLTLAELKAEAHCETCRITFGADLANSIEARFSVNPAVRRARTATYCIGGPANTPQIAAQIRLEPGATRREEFRPRPGPLRVRCYQAPGIVALSGTRVRVGPEGVRVAPGEEGVLEVTNALATEALVVVERETWRETAATAALVTSLQDFRDLFPAEAVAPGEEISIASLAVLFTDLRGSTQLYQQTGDVKAFAFVQNHFRYLVEAVARHRGGVVKTMGDAVMATFASGRDALEAAVDMQRGWDAFRRTQGNGTGLPPGAIEGLSLKVGLHQGPSIAINNRDRLDYFGTTVNTAARVQGQSTGGDVVFTRAVEEDPEVGPWLEAAGFRRESLKVALKGLSGEHTLQRLWPGGAEAKVPRPPGGSTTRIWE